MLLSVVAVLALVAGGLFAWDALRDDDVGDALEAADRDRQ